MWRTAVHPHVHGERIDNQRRDRRRCGSSPRTWGTLHPDIKPYLKLRFIPTYMGNARENTPADPSGSVHPHVHGERAVNGSTELVATGSSPRTWGTRLYSDTDSVCMRFIPTYMGNAPAGLHEVRIGAVHPHVHGERQATAMDPAVGDGSSPRTWGTQTVGGVGEVSGRFIPTYMGNATESRETRRYDQVHPHVHGERVICGLQRTGKSGSSPRTWGTRQTRPMPNRIIRFIPTYMGNASITTRFRPSTPVHPHVHGERSHMSHICAMLYGSSPRTWGTLK